MKKKEKIPTKYWRYCYRKINGKNKYVKVKKVGDKVKIRVVKRRT